MGFWRKNQILFLLTSKCNLNCVYCYMPKMKNGIGEKVMTTGLGRGVAISHGEAAEIPGVVVALGLSQKGIEYDAFDGKPVHIMFIVVNSKRKRAEYLEVLSTLTNLMRKENVREEIRCCSCSGEVEKVLHDAAQRAMASV